LAQQCCCWAYMSPPFSCFFSYVDCAQEQSIAESLL
jgi:hypothetical protein